MHDTAYEIGRRFFDIYATAQSMIVEIGSFNVNGTLRDFCPDGATYIGVDLTLGHGVDVVVAADAPLPIASSCADVVISSSTFEHDSFFWETFLEMMRIAKPGGVLYINAPSNGYYHRYPVDNWRFYPDCGHVFVRWAKKNGYGLVLLESFMAERIADVWNDFVAIFRKSPASPEAETRFISTGLACTNVWCLGMGSEVSRQREFPEDMVVIARLRDQVARLSYNLDPKSAEAVAPRDEAVAQRSANEMSRSRVTVEARETERVKKAIEKRRQKLLGKLPIICELLRGSLSERVVRHTKDRPKRTRGESHHAFELRVTYRRGRTRQFNVPYERVPDARHWLSKYQELKETIDAICELNYYLPRPRRIGRKPRRKPY